MKSIKCFINRWLTILELAKIFDAEDELLSKKQSYETLKTMGNGVLYSSGRHNHIWIQDLIKKVTKSKFTIGGQGNAHPDMYLNEGKNQYRVEMKGFEHKRKIRVSASKFFASNSSSSKLNKLKTKKDKDRLILSCYTDDYYLLTQTTTEVMKALDDIGSIQVYLIKTSDMIPLLKDTKKVPKSIIDLSEINDD